MFEVSAPPPARRVFCNRTLNLRSIRAVGFDMDYTLVHYNTIAWEQRAYAYTRDRLAERGWPVKSLEFDPNLVTLGLVYDLELGNIVKANRFGYVKRACHGRTMLDFDAQRRLYSRVLIDPREPRWEFINTLFGVSEGCLYAQLVDLLDQDRLHGVMGYADLYRIVRKTLDAAHMEGTLKGEIIDQPETFVEPDPELPLALLDLKHAGKKLMVITNSEWHYTSAMMTYCFDRYLPSGVVWRDLFDLVIVSARKPSFFDQRSPFLKVVSEDGLLRPVMARPTEPGTYFGGNATLLEDYLGVSEEEILYIGDHIHADVDASKTLLKWRTALVVRELEAELEALEHFRQDQSELSKRMTQKESLEYRYVHLKLAVQRAAEGYGPPVDTSPEALQAELDALREKLGSLDERIAPLARRSGTLFNDRWGPLMRAGNDKSYLARQVERSADIYMSRVSNLKMYTPFAYLRSPRGDLPHDRAST